MKKVVLTLTASLACLAAFGQGRISFQTDSLHLVYYQNTPGYTNGEAVYAAPGHMPAGVTLMADLYLGTSSTSLSLISSTTFSTVSAGKWNTLNYQSPTISGGTTVFVVAQIRDAAFAAPSTWDSATAPFGTFYGASQEFSFVLGTSSLQYPQMYNHNASLGGGFSTWQDGTEHGRLG